MLTKRVFVVTMIILCCFMFAACATPSKRTAYDGLNLSYATYDSALRILADLHKEKKLTEEQKDKAIQIGRAYKLAHNAAVATLLKYELSRSGEDEDAYILAFQEASVHLSKLVRFAREVMDEKKGDE